VNLDRVRTAGVETEWLQALVDASLEAFFVVEPIGEDEITDFRIRFVNERGARLLNRDVAALVDQRVNEVSPPYGRGFRRDIIDAYQEQRVISGETTNIAPEVAATKASYRIVPFGALIAIAVTDRSTERAAETESDTLRRLISAQIEASPTGLALVRPILDVTGRVEDVFFEELNEPAAAVIGRDRVSLKGTTLSANQQPQPGGLFALLEQSVRTRTVISTDYDARTSALRADWLNIQITPVGEFLIVHVDDVSQQRREEFALQAIVEQAQELILMTDRHGLVRYFNPYALSVTGLEAHAVLGRPMADFTVEHDRRLLYEVFKALRSGSSSVERHQIRVVDKEGSTRTLLGSTVPIILPSGEFDGVITISADISERLSSEEARNEMAAALSVAEQTERERIAGDIHDGPVQELAALSMRLGASSNSSFEALQIVLAQAEESVIAAIGELRSLMFQLSPPDLEGEGLAFAIRKRAEILFESTDTVVLVSADLRRMPASVVATTLFRVAQEALVNARKHAYASTVKVHLFDGHSEAGGDSKADGTSQAINLEIIDDGSGCDFSRLLQAPGHLGVSMMRDRARQLGGTCEILSTPGRGTTVRVSIPTE
jgi:PAS domain S-box-containing protein